jgi:hypothetical protein
MWVLQALILAREAGTAHSGRRPPIVAARVASQPVRFRTTDVRACALNARRRQTHLKAVGGVPNKRN